MELKHKSMKVVSLLMAVEITMASLFSAGTVMAEEGQEILRRPARKQHHKMRLSISRR